MAFVSIAKCRNQMDWKGVVRGIRQVISICDNIQRARIVSLVKCNALFFPKCTDATEEKVSRNMRKVVEISAANLLPRVTLKWPELLPLFDRAFTFYENKEFRRVVNMSIKCLPLITDSLRAKFDRSFAFVSAHSPRQDFIHDSGLIDIHTSKMTERSLNTFLTVGMLTHDTCAFTLDNKTIPELEFNYAKQKREAAVETLKRKKDDALENRNKTPAKKPRLAGKSLENDASDSSLLPSTPLKKDSEYVTLKGPLCGFKNASAVGEAVVDIENFKAGEEIFVKIGELNCDNHASSRVNTVMRVLAMPFVEVAIVPIAFDADRWKSHTTHHPTPVKASWPISMLKKLTGVVKKHALKKTVMNMQVCSVFHGIRLSDMKDKYKEMNRHVLSTKQTQRVLGKTLFENILLGVYVGVGDLGPFNCMINNSGEVLLVDIKISGEAAMAVYNTKGLYRSSRKFDEKHIDCVISYIKNNRERAADFLDRLTTLAPKNAFLLENMMCPFFKTENMEILRSGPSDHPYMKFLFKSLRYNPCIPNKAPPAYVEVIQIED